MRKYDLSINNNSYEVIVKKVTETEALVEVNGQEHTVSINQIESLILPESIPKPTQNMCPRKDMPPQHLHQPCLLPKEPSLHLCPDR